MGLKEGSLPVLNAGELGQEAASASGNREECLEPAEENKKKKIPILLIR